MMVVHWVESLLIAAIAWNALRADVTNAGERATLSSVCKLLTQGA